MDRDYYDLMEMIHQTRDYQIHKFLEASVYQEDLEAAYLEQIDDENVNASVAQWRKEEME